jgi:putative ABC transport system substrate-binding protein
MAIGIGRRKFIVALGGTAVAWPLTARAQRPALPVIGYLSSRSPESEVSYLAAFRQGLGTANYVENKNVTIEYRFADGQYDRNAALAKDLVRQQIAVIVSVGNNTAALAAKEATSSIPIVFVVGADPVQSGLVNSLNRPGGNLTGVYSQSGELAAKNVGLMHELVPQAHTIAVLVNPKVNQAQEKDVRAAARIETQIGQDRPIFLTQAAHIAALAARRRSERIPKQ